MEVCKVGGFAINLAVQQSWAAISIPKIIVSFNEIIDLFLRRTRLPCPNS